MSTSTTTSTTSKHAAEAASPASAIATLEQRKADLEIQLHHDVRAMLASWEAKKQSYQGEFYSYTVRGKEIRVANHTESLAHTRVPKISLPAFKDWGEIVRWCMQENVPGEFPFTAGVYPFKRTNEDPTRMFAGEGGPERTNKRFHYLSKGMAAARLSTAFDSVTLYGEDPDYRPDIYGKIGNSGVSVASLDDAKKLYSGFDLCAPTTSVSMTINGPAPMLLAFFMNAAIDQECEKEIVRRGMEDEIRAKIDAIYRERGIARPVYRHGDGSTELPDGNAGLGLMLLGVTGDQVLPPDVYDECKQRALQNVRGTVQADILKEDQAQNTCIFSTEFALRMMGDVQEYFINKAVRNFYSVSISGYHIAEAGANPITQLAFTLSNGFTFVEYYLSRGMNINDFAPNLSFFFSNGVDPEYSVIGRVARKIWSKAIKNMYGGNERSLQGSFIIEELTDLVEEAVYTEFKRISERGGVLGAMENMYQRNKIQEESLYYETLKHTGEYPIIGVNTFLSSKGSPTVIPEEVIRSTTDEKEQQIGNVRSVQQRSGDATAEALDALRSTAIRNGNIFDALMEAAKVCSLGQMTHALYEVGGQYRRTM